MNDLDAFARLVRALSPWREQLVLVGGWAHRLYRFHPLAGAPGYPTLLTRDTDLVFADRAQLEGDIKSALAAAGFSEEFSSDDRPPVTHYVLGGDDAGFYAEFLTPLQGSGRKRSGAADATISAAGISAQKLRYVEILLIEPWHIAIGPNQGFPLPVLTKQLVANPVALIVQKLLIQPDRPPRKRAQDILYIHDTLELFGAELAALNELWHHSIYPALQGKTSKQFRDISLRNFSEVTDLIRDAAQIAGDRNLSPERMQEMCQIALAELFA